MHYLNRCESEFQAFPHLEVIRDGGIRDFWTPRSAVDSEKFGGLTSSDLPLEIDGGMARKSGLVHACSAQIRTSRTNESHSQVCMIQ